MQATRVLYHNNATQRVFEAVAALPPGSLVSRHARNTRVTHTHTRVAGPAVRGEFLDEIIFFARCTHGTQSDFPL